MSAKKVVLDTHIFISALIGKKDSYSRLILNNIFDEKIIPLMGEALFHELQDVMERDALFARCALNKLERSDLFEAFLGCCKWTRIYYLWRPNLRDEADNHLIELAVAGGAETIITENLRDFTGGELNFPYLKVVTPETFIKEV